MSEAIRTTRRDVLRWLLGAATLCATGLPARASLATAEARAVARLGAAHLAEHPEEADAGVLRRRLGLPSGPLPEVLAACGPRLAAARRADFRRGRTARLDGWVLSRTELRLCALLHLEAGPHST